VFEGNDYTCVCTDGKPDCIAATTPQPLQCTAGQTWFDVFEGSNYECVCVDGKPDCTATGTPAAPCVDGTTWTDLFEGDHYSCKCIDGQPDCTDVDFTAASPNCEEGQEWTDVTEGENYHCICADGQPDCIVTDESNNTATILISIAVAVFLIACVLNAFYCLRVRGKTTGQNRFVHLSLVTEKKAREDQSGTNQPLTPNEKTYREKKERTTQVAE